MCIEETRRSNVPYMLSAVCALYLSTHVSLRDRCDESEKNGTNLLLSSSRIASDSANIYQLHDYSTYFQLSDTIRAGHCTLQHMSSILHCASQMADNRDCCAMLHMSEQRLDAPRAEHCLRFCDPAGSEPIKALTLNDISCLYNLNVIYYCHHSGLRA